MRISRINQFGVGAIVMSAAWILCLPAAIQAATFNPFQPQVTTSASAAPAKAAVAQPTSSAVLVPVVKPADTTPVNPGTPTINISDSPNVNETSPNATAVFKVTLTKASKSVVTVHYATANGTARNGWDYVAQSGTLTFKPGQSLTQTVSIRVLTDFPNGPNDQKETMFVNLSSPTNAKIGDGTGEVTLILGNSTNMPKFQVFGTTVTEGKLSKTVSVKVTLSFGINKDSAFYFQTIDGSAKAGRDYARVAYRVQFGPNQTSAFLPITIFANTGNPGSRFFTVGIAQPTAAGLANQTATVTILK